MTEFTMTLPSPVSFVLDRLKNAGYSAYCVGGCVRDSLMGKLPSDFDVTTSAKPHEMQAVFEDCRVVETGLKHGTLTVVLDGMNIEITTYRIDGAYDDCRHPDGVTFTDRLSDDLCRRDFTVNAMAYSPADGLVDLYDGQGDLCRGVIRCVGRANERFSEDGLRILRALRFSSVLGFTPDDECASAVALLTPLLGKISRERIYTEITKLLGGKNCAAILSRFPSTVAFALGIGEEDVLRAARAFEGDKIPSDPLIRYAVLLDSLSDADAERVFGNLKPSREEKRTVFAYRKHRDSAMETDYDIKKLMSEEGTCFPPRLAEYRALVSCGNADDVLRVRATAERILSSGDCVSLSSLAVSGNDLLSLGFRGRAVGDCLARLFDGVLRGETENRRDVLMNLAEIEAKKEHGQEECEKKAGNLL